MATQKRCPLCQATVFHRAIFVNLIDGEEKENRREYRCVNCNNQMEISMMEDFTPLGEGYSTMIQEAGVNAIAGQSMSTEEFLRQGSDKPVAAAVQSGQTPTK